MVLTEVIAIRPIAKRIGEMGGEVQTMLAFESAIVFITPKSEKKSFRKAMLQKETQK